ncbi:MAG: conjugal transfer protein TraG N-terminal domain-containing protein [Methylococcaceae bacterium]|nr:conjugal transfer protein TraG N-terminal domain-containing protein [Methylococcaceae bacterium]
MDVGSTINIYGNLFGWHVYGLLYEFVVSTGLWLIPFFIFLYQTFVDRGYGESDNYLPKNALISMEKKVYTSLIVIAVFFTPVVSMSKTSFVYNDGTKIQAAGATDSRLDGLNSSIPASVKIPAGWYTVMLFTSSLNGVVKKILPNQYQVRDLMYDMQQVSLEDAELQAQINDFEARCRQPAQGRLNAIRQYFPDSKIGKKLSKYQKDTQVDIESKNAIIKFLDGGTDHWRILEKYPGNNYFMETLYDDTLLCAIGENPNTSNCIPKTSNPLSPPDGKTCKSWWASDLKGKLGTAFGKAPSILSINDDMFVSSKLMALGGSTKGGEKGVGNKEGNLWQWGEEKATGLMLNVANFINSATNSAVRFALPIIQGMILMIIFMVLVLFILIGKYDLSKMAGIIILLFGITFLTSIWNIIGWIDNIMLLTIHGGVKGVFEYVGDAFSLELAVWNIVVFFAYGAATVFWIRFIGELGASGSHAASGMMGGVRDAGNSMGKGGGLIKKGGEAVKNKFS